jgi:medium-chain acyl-[acyl-carrier-protein] hydrolase
VSQPWLRRFSPRPEAALRLFCFSYAGGGTAVFRPWADDLPAEIEVCAVQLPARESRFREPPIASMQGLVDALIPAIEPELDRPFALFGHSMGSLLAFEVVRALQRRGLRCPTHLLVSGRRAPHLPEPESAIHMLDDDAFVAEIDRRYGGIPAEVLRHRDVLALLLPSLRADMAAIETHCHLPGDRLPCPITAFGGDADPRVPLVQLQAWQDYAAAPIRLRLFAGGHFYFSDAQVRGALLRDVADVLLQPMASQQVAASPQ